MRCTAKNADETPCTAEATTRVLSNGYFVYVCAFHNGMMSKAVQSNRVPGLGAFPEPEQLDGLVFKPKRDR